MKPTIHGHEVMQMMLASDQPYTRETLRAAIRDRFGADARFHTCSASAMTAEELISFLEERGKFVPQGDGFNTAADKICNH